MQSMTTGNVIQLAMFKANAGASYEAVRTAMEKAGAFLAAGEGFIDREYSYSPSTGQWVDYIRWASEPAAEKAAELFNAAPEAQDLVALVDPETVQLHHLTVESAA
jgi:hypothetical protein